MDSVSLPLDEIDEDVQGLDDVMATWATGDTLPAASREGRIFRTRAGGIYYDAGTHWITLLGDPDTVHVVGTPGEPAFEGGWLAQPGHTAQFWRDQHGLVHIRAGVRAAGDGAGTMFTLPSAYRPRTNVPISAVGTSQSTSDRIGMAGYVTTAGSVGLTEFPTVMNLFVGFSIVFDPAR